MYRLEVTIRLKNNVWCFRPQILQISHYKTKSAPERISACYSAAVCQIF